MNVLLVNDWFISWLAVSMLQETAGDGSWVIYTPAMLDADITLGQFISALTFSGQSMFRNVKSLHLSTDVLIQEISDVQLWKR